MRIFNSSKLQFILLFVCIALQASITLTFSLTLRYELKSSGADGALFAQVLYNAIHGHGLVTSIAPPFILQHWFGIHFSPILYLLTPLYYVFPHVETLLVVHSFAIALAAWPIFLTAEHILRSRWQALIVALLYLTSPFVINAAIWDFHEIAFAPLVLAFMMWSIVIKNRAALLFFCAILLTIKTHYGLAVFGSGLLWAWHWRDVRFGTALAAFGLFAFILVLFVIMPHYSAIGNVAWISQSASGLDRFSWLSNPFGSQSPLHSIIMGMLPYILTLGLSLWLLPLTAPMWLLPGLADFSVNISSTNPMMRSVLSYHSAALIPIILVAYCAAIHKYFGKNRSAISTKDATFCVVILSIFYNFVQMALPFPGMRNIWEFSSPQITYGQEDSKALEAINTMIPNDVAVSAQNNVLPHLNPRYLLYPFPDYFADSQYIVLYLSFPYQHTLMMLGSPYGIASELYYDAVDKLLANPEWGIVFSANRWVVLKKNSTDTPDTRSIAVAALAKARAEYKDANDNVTRDNANAN